MNSSSPITTLSKTPIDHIRSAVLVGTIFPLCLIGIIGNVVTIATILISRKLKSTWYDLILSLSVSDLISAVISPLFAYRVLWGKDEWNLPGFLCKLYWGFDIWTSYSTTLHILWFAILRFISIKWPHSFTTVLARYTKMSIIFIWLLTFVTGFVPSMWIRAETRNRSDPFPTSQWPACSATKDVFTFIMIYSLTTFALYIYIPCILVVAVSVAIGIRISNMRKERRNRQGDRQNEAAEQKRTRKENQLLLQLGLIVGSFIIGYYPLTGPHTKNRNWWLKALQVILLRISECLNPVFYNLASSKMRKETMLLLRRFWLKIRCKADQAPANVNQRSEKTSPSKIATEHTNIACSRV